MKQYKRKITELLWNWIIYIVKHVEIPLSIVECGFLSNPEEEKQLLEDDYQDHLAWGIYMGIINYFNN